MRNIRASVGVVLLLATFLVMTSVPTSADLTKVSADIRYTPEEPMAGKPVSFTIEIKNEDTAQIKLKYIGIHLDWQKTGTYIFEDDSTSPVLLSPGMSHRVILSLTIPENTSYGTHPYFLRVDYDSGASGFSDKSKEYQDFSLNPPEPPPPPADPPIWQSPYLLGLIVIVILAIVLMAWLGSSRKKRLKEQLQKRKKYKSALSSEEVAADIELAQTVATKRSRPRSSMAMKAEQEGKREKIVPWEPDKEKKEAKVPEPKPAGVVHMPSAPPPTAPATLGGSHQPMPPPLSQTQMKSVPMPQKAPGPPPTPMPTGPPSRPSGALPPPPPPPPQVPPRPPPPRPPTAQGAPPPWPQAKAPPPIPPSIPPPVPPAGHEGTSPERCPKCGTTAGPDDITCPRCGALF